MSDSPGDGLQARRSSFRADGSNSDSQRRRLGSASIPAGHTMFGDTRDPEQPTRTSLRSRRPAWPLRNKIVRKSSRCSFVSFSGEEGQLPGWPEWLKRIRITLLACHARALPLRLPRQP